jgi:REP element-mobilizing transposase RayT
MDKLPIRKSIRLKEYDYSQAGYYFITICTVGRLGLFGQIVGADDPVCPKPVMTTNEIGKIVVDCWNRINDIYDNVTTDAFCIMPNHIHGIIVINEGGQGRPPLHKIIQGFKSVTARLCFKYNISTIWQKNYYEHIIRNEQEYLKICEYIEWNPLKWIEDEYYVKFD